MIINSSIYKLMVVVVINMNVGITYYIIKGFYFSWNNYKKNI